jgi:hypothetical protein
MQRALSGDVRKVHPPLATALANIPRKER